MFRARSDAGEQRLRVLLNDRFLGAFDVGADWVDEELAVPADAARAGRNFVRLRRPGEGPWEGGIAVAGAWLEPE